MICISRGKYITSLNLSSRNLFKSTSSGSSEHVTIRHSDLSFFAYLRWSEKVEIDVGKKKHHTHSRTKKEGLGAVDLESSVKPKNLAKKSNYFAGWDIYTDSAILSKHNLLATPISSFIYGESM